MTISASTEQLRELLSKVERAMAPDREIDGAVAVVLRDLKPTIQPWAKENFPEWSSDSTGRIFGIHEDGSLGPNWLSDHYTASVDASLGLVERVLPGWMVDHIGAEALGMFGAMETVGWSVDLHDGHNYAQGQSPSLCLAILAALLKAILAASERAVQS